MHLTCKKTISEPIIASFSSMYLPCKGYLDVWEHLGLSDTGLNPEQQSPFASDTANDLITPSNCILLYEVL